MPEKDASAPDDLTLRIERVLTTSLGGVVRLGEPERIALRGRQTQLYRFPLIEAPLNAPRTIVMKRADPNDYRPDDPESWQAQTLFGEWAGLEFLSRYEVAGCPRFYGGDREMGFVLMEDLGKIRDVADILLNGAAPEAENALVLLAGTVGQMHAATCGKADEYRQMRRALGPGDGWTPTPQQFRETAEKLAAHLATLDIPAHPKFLEDVETLGAAIAEPGAFLAYTHGDPCPDNLAVVDGGLRLFDYAVGAMRHALTDGVYGWIRFPTCWCVRDIPENVLTRMDETYRKELVEGCPEAADDRTYRRGVAEACGYWLFWSGFLWTLERMREFDQIRGPSTQRQRLVKRLAAFVRAAEEAECFGGLRDTCGRLLEHLRREWGDDMPLYPAFYVPALPESAETAEFLAAVRENAVERVRDLLRRNPALAHARLTEGEEMPVLFDAVRRDQRDIAKALLEHGADVQGLAGSWRTILSHACETASSEVVELLAQHGANPNLRNGNGRLPLHDLIEHHPDRLDALLALGAKLDLAAAIQLNREDVVEEILKRDPSQVHFQVGGWSPLHFAAKQGSLSLARLLLEHGARLDIKTWEGQTPSDIAEQRGDAEMMSLLHEWKMEG